MTRALRRLVQFPALPARVALAILLVALAPAAAAQPAEFRYQFCARGTSEAPERPFTKTVRLELIIRGVALPGDLQAPVAEKLLKETLWTDPAIVVALEVDAPGVCPSSGIATQQIEIALTPETVDKIRAETRRGPRLTLSIHAVAGKIKVSLTRSGELAGPARQWLKVFYATNRKRTSDASALNAYGTERVEQLGFGAVEVAVPYRPDMKDTQSPAIFATERLLDADSLELGARLQPMSLEQWKQTIATRAETFGSPGILVFIHGFNVSFASAARRAAQLAYDLAFPGPTVFLAWPSDGALPSYLRDSRDAENSSIAAARVLDEVSSSRNGPVYVIAHSMGNRVMMEAYKRLLDDKPERAARFREIVMAAPDVDQESFQLYTANKILPSGPRFTLYASKHDLALASSEFVQGGQRLGFGGESLYVQAHLDSIDASAVTKEFFSLNHSYFGDTTTVMSDLYRLIRYRMPADRRPNLRLTRVRNHNAYVIVP